MRTFVDHTPRIAVVGYGRWGRQCHTYLINLTDGLELRCVVSSDAHRLESMRDAENTLMLDDEPYSSAMLRASLMRLLGRRPEAKKDF